MLQQLSPSAESATLENLSGILERQQAALLEAADHTRRLQAQLFALALHSGTEAHEGGPGVEEISDPERVRDLMASVGAVARQQIRVIQPSAVARHLITDWLRDGCSDSPESVEVRTIHQSSLLQSARSLAYLESLSRRKVHVRVAPLLPFRLIVVDEAFGLVCPPDAMLLIREQALVRLLCRMFEFCWDDARDLHTALSADGAERPAGAATGRMDHLALSEQQLVILRLWAKGRQDAAIARELQVSPRTLRRMVSALLRRLKVSSRFEAGVVAARTPELLDCEEPSQPPA